MAGLRNQPQGNPYPPNDRGPLRGILGRFCDTDGRKCGKQGSLVVCSPPFGPSDMRHMLQVRAGASEGTRTDSCHGGQGTPEEEAMGLDLVEFTIAVEDAFQVAIPDADAAKVRTPAQLVDYLMARLPRSDSTACLEQRAFYAVRQAGIRVLEAPRSTFRPDIQWDDLIPPGQRRDYWRLLHNAAGTSKWPRLTLFGKFHRGTGTIGGTARYLATYTPGALKRDDRKGWSRAEVEHVIRLLMAEEFGIADFRWDQEFVRDLGLD